ncbi:MULTISPECIES: uroporphyrinogen-III synthase [Virgibacillus]|uniref:Uroporphyrinogen-III synthase n=2 Tax=Virgibacillus TaxID=84406 RepID=A0A024QAY2_9BACI|nr:MULTISPECIES: uroporphyrinogen-III synthase [Virgibacillus]EQB35810.1 hypothetical protein M948_12285 [Virgibacillus sp. CM-4]MYL41613.1 uroporphyrinogen-III synthase [Virgibacillus massiliensis]GGJ49452.1 uroporphyrinogen-III synthase [Virgibacillus kapii]CDQ39422.1 uroporphyrinogen-III synthase [Virgibacillus massiliensis]
MSFPLQNKRILITREKKKTAAFSEKIKQLGGVPIEIPLLRIECSKTKENHLDFKRLDTFDWILFTSSNGVDCFFQLANYYQVNQDILHTKNIAVVGRKTEETLILYGRKADFIPSTYNAATMAEEFLTSYPDATSILLVRGNRSRDVLPNRLKAAEKAFTAMEVYETHANYSMKNKLREQLLNSQIDYITFTSPSTVESFVEMTTMDVAATCVCIGSTTKQRAKELGFSSILMPSEYTIDGMIARIQEDIIRKGKK